MKLAKSIFSIIILAFLFSCQSSPKLHVTKYEDDSIKEEWQIVSEQDLTKHGVYRAFYKSGTLKENAMYNNGELSGTRKLYFDNGQVMIEENYVQW